jgi:hypothetical protein
MKRDDLIEEVNEAVEEWLSVVKGREIDELLEFKQRFAGYLWHLGKLVGELKISHLSNKHLEKISYGRAFRKARGIEGTTVGEAEAEANEKIEATSKKTKALEAAQYQTRTLWESLKEILGTINQQVAHKRGEEGAYSNLDNLNELIENYVNAAINERSS